MNADTATIIGVQPDGTEKVLGTAPIPPKLKARDIVCSYFGEIDEDAGNDGAMALWACNELVDWMAVPRPAFVPTPMADTTYDCDEHYRDGPCPNCRPRSLLASRAVWIGGAVSLAAWSGAIGFVLGLLKGGA